MATAGIPPRGDSLSRVRDVFTGRPAVPDSAPAPGPETVDRNEGGAFWDAVRRARGAETTAAPLPGGPAPVEVRQRPAAVAPAQATEAIQRAIDDLGRELGKAKPGADRVYDLLMHIMSRSDNKRALAEYTERTHQDLVVTLGAKFGGRELAHALAYVRNESGRLEKHDAIFFLSNGWTERLVGGLATAEASFTQLIESIRPDEVADINQKLWTYYPTDTSWTQPTQSARIRENPPAELLDVPQGVNPLEIYIRREFSLQNERWLLASLRMPKDHLTGELDPAYRTAFAVSEAKGVSLLRLLESQDKQGMAHIAKAFGELHAQGVLPKAKGATLEAHARHVLSVQEKVDLALLNEGLMSGTDASRNAAAHYAAHRLDACFGNFNDDEDEMVRVLTTLVGDGAKLPTFAQLAAHSSRKTLGQDLIDNLSGDQESIARLVVAGGHIHDPEVVAARLMRADAPTLTGLLTGIPDDQMAAIRRAAEHAFGQGAVRNHIGSVAGFFLDGKKQLPSRALALYDRGDSAAMSGYPPGMFEPGREGSALSPAAKLVYAFHEGWGTDEKAAFDAVAVLSEQQKQALPAAYLAIAQRTTDARPFEVRVASELSADDARALLRTVQPFAAGDQAQAVRATADVVAQSVIRELTHGWPSLRSAFDMEAGALHEAIREFRNDVGAVLDRIEARRPQPPVQLTPEELAAVEGLSQRLMDALEPFVSEREAVKNVLRTVPIAVGAAIGAVVAAKVSVVTFGATAPLAVVLAKVAGGFGGAAVAAMSYSAMEGDADLKSSKFWVRDGVAAGLEGAFFVAAAPAQLAALAPSAMRTLPWLAKLGPGGTAALLQASAFGGASVSSTMGQKLTDREFQALEFHEQLAESFRDGGFAFATGFGLGLSFAGVSALSSLRQSASAAAVEQASQQASGAATPAAQAAEAQATRSIFSRAAERWQKMMAAVSERERPAAVQPAAVRATPDYVQRMNVFVRTAYRVSPSALQRRLVMGQLEKELGEALRVGMSELDLSVEAARIATNLAEAGIEAPSTRLLSGFQQVFTRLGCPMGETPEAINAWLNGIGIKNGVFTDRLGAALHVEAAKAAERAAPVRVAQTAAPQAPAPAPITPKVAEPPAAPPRPTPIAAEPARPVVAQAAPPPVAAKPSAAVAEAKPAAVVAKTEPAASTAAATAAEALDKVGTKEGLRIIRSATEETIRRVETGAVAGSTERMSKDVTMLLYWGEKLETIEVAAAQRAGVVALRKNVQTTLSAFVETNRVEALAAIKSGAKDSTAVDNIIDLALMRQLPGDKVRAEAARALWDLQVVAKRLLGYNPAQFREWTMRYREAVGQLMGSIPERAGAMRELLAAGKMAQARAEYVRLIKEVGASSDYPYSTALRNLWNPGLSWQARAAKARLVFMMSQLSDIERALAPTLRQASKEEVIGLAQALKASPWVIGDPLLPELKAAAATAGYKLGRLNRWQVLILGVGTAHAVPIVVGGAVTVGSIAGTYFLYRKFARDMGIDPNALMQGGQLTDEQRRLMEDMGVDTNQLGGTTGPLQQLSPQQQSEALRSVMEQFEQLRPELMPESGTPLFQLEEVGEAGEIVEEE